MIDPPPVSPNPPPPPAQQAMVQLSDRMVLATGFFPAGSPDPATVEIEDLDADAWAEFQAAPPGQKHLAEDGTLTVTPPPPPPIVYARLAPVDTRVRTTDDQPLEVFRFPAEVRHVYRAAFRMTAVDATSGATRDTEARMVFKRPGATLVQVGATVLLANFADTATTAWAIIPTVEGTDLVISVRGAAGRTVDWLLFGEIGTFAPEGLAEA